MKLKMLLVLFVAAPIVAAPPRLSGGSLQTVPSLAQAEAIGNGWIAYSVATPKGFSACGCSLTSENNSINWRDSDDIGPSASSALLFTRMRDKQPDRVRLFSPDCSLDASGQTIYWIDNVSPAESMAFLKRIVDSGGERVSHPALLALSLHPGGTETLIDIAKHNQSSRTRGNALFWLSQQAGEKAAATLRDAVDNDPEEQVRSKAVFGIAQLPNDQSIPMLIDLLKHNRSREVRKKAAFWLGQKNDPRALQAIEEILKQ